jgi:hypothetical protein
MRYVQPDLPDNLLNERARRTRLALMKHAASSRQKQSFLGRAERVKTTQAAGHRWLGEAAPWHISPIASCEAA